MRCSLLAGITIAAACSSSSTAGVPLPKVTIAQTSTVAPLRMGTQSGVPVDYQLSVTNPASHAVTLTAVEIETVGESGAYLLKRVRHTFNHVIPARASISIPVRAWVQPLQESQKGDVDSPVMLRGTAMFDSMGEAVQSSFAGRVARVASH